MAARIPARPAPTTTTSCRTINASGKGWSQQSSAYQAGPSSRVACEGSWGILDQGAVAGYGRAVTIPGRNLGEDGVCVAGGTARSSEPVAERAARPDASDVQHAEHRLRRSERPDAGSGALEGQHVHRVR